MAVIIIANIWGKGMIKVIPILLGVVIPYIVALCCGMVDFTEAVEANWAGVAPFVLAKFDITAILVMAPIAIAAIAGVGLNAILPGNDYVFGSDSHGDGAANLGTY